MSVMSMSGDLQINEACVGPPGTKVLFWLTGVGVLAAKVQSTIDEDIGIISHQKEIPGQMEGKTSRRVRIAAKHNVSTCTSIC